MGNDEIIARLEALCERPLAGGQAESAELQAFYREVAKALSQADEAAAGTRAGAADDTDLTGALAALLSGSDSDDARRIVEQALLGSEAARLDVQAALAFVDAIEQSPQAAPADLVEELLTADRVKAAGWTAGGASLWSRLTGASWSARGWRMAAASLVLAIAGVVTWSDHWQRLAPADNSPPPANAVAPAPPPQELAKTGSCETSPQTSDAAKAQTGKAQASRTQASKTQASKTQAGAADADCGADGQTADRARAEELEAIAARRQAEAARQAAAAAAATEAAKAGTAQADSPGLSFGRNHPPAAAAATPAVPAMRPSGVR